jgi:hypothetical protein
MYVFHYKILFLYTKYLLTFRKAIKILIITKHISINTNMVIILAIYNSNLKN